MSSVVEGWEWPRRLATCGTILYPNVIRDIINFSLRDCAEKNIPVRRCRNCGRYFPIIGRITAEYCSRPQPSGKLCRNIAPVQKWAKQKECDSEKISLTEFKEWLKN